MKSIAEGAGKAFLSIVIGAASLSGCDSLQGKTQESLRNALGGTSNSQSRLSLELPVITSPLDTKTANIPRTTFSEPPPQDDSAPLCEIVGKRYKDVWNIHDAEPGETGFPYDDPDSAWLSGNYTGRIAGYYRAPDGCYYPIDTEND